MLRRTSSVVIGLCMLAACGGGSGGGPPSISGENPDPSQPNPSANPSYHLQTTRFTTHQPEVLEQIGAHHAYALGLSGRGIRIGIEDSIVDYTQRAEFGSRIRLRDADGAVLSYLRPDGDDFFSEIDNCRYRGTCDIWKGDSGGDAEERNNWVRQIVDEDGWPTRDDSVFVVDTYYSEYSHLERIYRWSEVPTPYGVSGSHGTIVASAAAGRNLGVAPEATIIPIATNLTDDQASLQLTDDTLRLAIQLLPSFERNQFDREFASNIRAHYANFDIINRSFGTSLFDPDLVAYRLDSELDWYRRYLPRTLNAQLQIGTADARKTILVYAAGNEAEAWSSLEADLPYYLPARRGHAISVVATNPATGLLAQYSNRCGPLPDDWNAGLHGPHYCLAAPGTVRGLIPNPSSPGRGTVGEGHGTSFAAPVVSGALALMMEHFRGTRGNTEILRRMLDTADRRGSYADLETYGAGHLDLAAALSPVGALTAGQLQSAVGSTVLQTPAAFGAVDQRAAGIEIAAFDSQDFPFWSPVSSFVVVSPEGRSPIPLFGNDGRAVLPSADLTPRRMQWAATGTDVSERPTWIAGYGPSALSVARLPGTGGWGYGLSYSDGEHLGGKTSGAFGSQLRSGSLWAARSITHEFGRGISLHAEGALAVSVPQYETNALFTASTALLSAASVRIGDGSTGFTVEQPLRAEAGTGTFRVENGIIENGRRLVDTHHVSLRPDAREMSVALRHDVEALDGSLALAVGGSMHAGHRAGATEGRVGVAYRTVW
ncbi:MAG: S8 family serine peptidase [Rhodospirillales bacterium]|nr:S8 family serine peptidase [Rhodospirillales bacterium]